MKKVSLIIIVLFIVASCSKKKEYEELKPYTGEFNFKMNIEIPGYTEPGNKINEQKNIFEDPIDRGRAELNRIYDEYGLNGIVNHIRGLDELEGPMVGGFIPFPSINYKYFLMLKAKSTESELVEFSNDKNPILSTYATYALIDKGYNKTLADKFQRVYHNQDSVRTYEGCIIDDEQISRLIYERLDNYRGSDSKSYNILMNRLDSIVLNSEVKNVSLLNWILKEKRVPNSYDKTILTHASEGNYNSLVYLLNKNYSLESKQITECIRNIWDYENYWVDWSKLSNALYQYNSDLSKKVISNLMIEYESKKMNDRLSNLREMMKYEDWIEMNEKLKF